MSPVTETGAALRAEGLAPRRLPPSFGSPRELIGHRFVYVVVSARARGLSVGVNMNPDRRCNFDCVYCEVSRQGPVRERRLEVDVMATELAQTLEWVQAGQLRQLPCYRNMPAELLPLRHVALSGDGEPTLCPVFAEAVQAVVHVRARGQFPFFKIVVITNGTGLDLPEVQHGLKFLIHQDEVWAKLDAGTPEYMARVNRPQVGFEKVLANLLLVGRQRPIIIQSLFPLLEGQEPPDEEIDAYAARLRQLRSSGAQITLVQIYSASRPSMRSDCAHLPLKSLSRIAHKVRDATGLEVEVF
jgi:wyosine [tRNA(Phe)-imidazoG37] synthetase (radical SAM superfamily)